MRKTQSNYVGMSSAVLDVFDNRKSVWENKALVSAGYARLKALSKDINETAAKQKENAPEGYTAAKEEARTELEELLFVVGRKLRAFARLEDDVVAATQSDFSRSSLDILSFSNLLNLARAIVEVCKARLTQLKAYEIDEVALDELQTAIDKLASSGAHRDAMLDFRMENTSSIEKLLSKMRRELKTMDALVEGFIFDEAFLTVYFNARRIHDVRGGNRKKEEEVKG
ncbi:MAG: hypothetical protein LBR81_02810 [Prevotellaceae bacterium]|jgi:hypothetical protein|nr:hypothetical protein [Prevotellaceae bacterium]